LTPLPSAFGVAVIVKSFGRIFSLNGCFWNVAAVEVDLTGQVNAETASGVSVGGTGGQGDFVRGAKFGAAELRAQPIDERIRRMIAISHPNFLESLQREARVFVNPI
jgi:acyl-CoA hydrolase